MSKREKIIVSVMVATFLLGGYLYFIPEKTADRRVIETQMIASAQDFVQKAIQKFKEDTTLEKELHTIRNADRKWGKDPFLKSDALLSDAHQKKISENKPVTAETQSDFSYTGFLEVGTQRLAIINGMEYTSGEAIDEKGYYVRRIQPHQVEIGRRNTPDTVVLNRIDQ